MRIFTEPFDHEANLLLDRALLLSLLILFAEISLEIVPSFGVVSVGDIEDQLLWVDSLDKSLEFAIVAMTRIRYFLNK